MLNQWTPPLKMEWTLDEVIFTVYKKQEKKILK
jgi:hypothetical protein